MSRHTTPTRTSPRLRRSRITRMARARLGQRAPISTLPVERSFSVPSPSRSGCPGAERVGVTQSAVSQHLRVLRQAGLVRGERRGHFVHYSLDQDRLEQYKTRLRETLGEGFVVVE
jgi:DNA-binding transcriptional ArsR family regulator